MIGFMWARVLFKFIHPVDGCPLLKGAHRNGIDPVDLPSDIVNHPNHGACPDDVAILQADEVLVGVDAPAGEHPIPPAHI